MFLTVFTFIAAAFILCSVKHADLAVDLIKRQMQTKDPTIRLCAIIRFHVLWRNRYHCWLKMEEGAHLVFKVDFVSGHNFSRKLRKNVVVHYFRSHRQESILLFHRHQLVNLKRPSSIHRGCRILKLKCKN